MDQSGNPFSIIKRIEDSQELLDLAFSKAMKVKPPGMRMDGLNRSRTHEINRINTSANVLVNRLERIVKSFPSLNLIHPFYLELSSILVDTNELKLALGRIFGIIKHIRDVEYELVAQLLATNSKAENRKIRKIAFGRFSSMIEQLKPFLKILEQGRVNLRPLPGFDPYLPSIVVAGAPNTGKSSFIKLTTSGKPDIASYPFTTRKLIFGHRKLGYLTIQFIDTPGLLDRALDKRNKIELQALTALKHLSDIIVFLIDISQNASTSITDQLNLLSEINEFYPVSELIIVVSKSDLINIRDITNVKMIIEERNLIEKNGNLITMHSNDLNGVLTLLNRINDLLKNKVLLSSKFKEMTSPVIAHDQLPLEDDPMWLSE